MFKNLVVHPQTVARAHLAGCAAALQGKFKEYYNLFWEKGFKAYQETRDASKMGEEAILSWVSSVGIDPAKLKADMDGQDCKGLIDSDAAEMRKFRVGSTPSFFINGKYVAGAMDAGAFKQLIDRELKIVEASGVPAAEYYDKVVIGKGEKAFRAAGQPKAN